MIPMQRYFLDIKIMAGTDQFHKMSELGATVPFADQTVEFLDKLSTFLMRDKEAQVYADVITFAFFCRRGNISKCKKGYGISILDRLGKGLTFHLAPSNVPVNFAYSLVAGLLAGNACIVRVSTKEYPQVEIICRGIESVLNNEKFKTMKDRISVITFLHNRNTNSFFSLLCDARIIWGGDRAIAEIRKAELPSRTLEMTFADRYSLCVMDAKTYIQCESKGNVAENFYNDTYLFDQNACSSPILIYWLGKDEDINIARDVFWEEMYAELRKKNYVTEPVTAVEKYVTLCKMAIDGKSIKEYVATDSLIHRVMVTELDKELLKYKCAGGFFLEYAAENMDCLKKVITGRCQTLTYFGIHKNEICSYVIREKLSGIDRIVPIGKATEFSLVWDGADFILQLSRKIVKL